jgi:predicted DNA-binding WGR domain protein
MIELIAGFEVDVVEKHELICTVDGHNKYWSGTFGVIKNAKGLSKPFVVALNWGKIGNTKQVPDLKRFTSHSTAESYLRGRIKDKRNKGYVNATAATDSPAGAGAPLSAVFAASYNENVYEWDIL